MTVTLYPGAISNLLRSPTGPVGKKLRTKGLRVKEVARALAPVDGGPDRKPGPHLRDTIELGVMHVGATGLVQPITVGTDHAVYVSKGTSAHEIRPRTAKVLRFHSAGTVIFAHLVHHPGTKPNDYLQHALRLAN